MLSTIHLLEMAWVRCNTVQCTCVLTGEVSCRTLKWLLSTPLGGDT